MAFHRKLLIIASTKKSKYESSNLDFEYKKVTDNDLNY